MRRNIWILFFVILALTIISGLIDWPTGPNFFGKEIKIHEGLDLQGGTHLVYQMDTSKIDSKDITTATQSTINIIEQRVNGLGVSEPVIQSSNIGNKSTIIVELPGISDVNEAINLIGKTAQLKFQEEDPANAGKFIDTSLTGADLQRAGVDFNQTSGEPEVSLQFNSNGTKLFADLTQKKPK